VVGVVIQVLAAPHGVAQAVIALGAVLKVANSANPLITSLAKYY
jgi:hypothetical protein